MSLWLVLNNQRFVDVVLASNDATQLTASATALEGAWFHYSERSFHGGMACAAQLKASHNVVPRFVGDEPDSVYASRNGVGLYPKVLYSKAVKHVKAGYLEDYGCALWDHEKIRIFATSRVGHVPEEASRLNLYCQAWAWCLSTDLRGRINLVYCAECSHHQNSQYDGREGDGNDHGPELAPWSR